MKTTNEILVSISKELNVIQEQLKELHKMDKEFIEVKEPLFITEDGVGLYEDDLYFYVNSHFQYIGTGNVTKKYPDGNGHYFSTKEAAEAWIKENKPEFSRKQILDALNKSESYLHGTSTNINFLAIRKQEFLKELGL